VVVAMGISAAAMHTRRPRVDSAVDALIAEAARYTLAEDITVVADITAAADIMALVSDSVSAFTRPTDMPLRFAIPPDSMTQTGPGYLIQAALYRTGTKLSSPHDL
jgi:hypothetical protein